VKLIAWYDPTNGVVSTDKDSPLFTPLGQVWPLYPPRTWTGLTKDEQLKILWDTKYPSRDSLMRAVEAKLKEKNT